MLCKVVRLSGRSLARNDLFSFVNRCWPRQCTCSPVSLEPRMRYSDFSKMARSASHSASTSMSPTCESCIRSIGTDRCRWLMRATMFVRHTVSEYKTWRKAYDDFAPVQKARGVTAQAVYRAVDNRRFIGTLRKAEYEQRSKLSVSSRTVSGAASLMCAPWDEARRLKMKFRDDALKIVARGGDKEGHAAASQDCRNFKNGPLANICGSPERKAQDT